VVRTNTGVYTDVRYKELQEKASKRKLSLYNKINLYFFGEEEICLSDALWFYGFWVFCGAAFLFLVLINLIAV
jgi:hypothetical protein